MFSQVTERESMRTSRTHPIDRADDHSDGSDQSTVSKPRTRLRYIKPAESIGEIQVIVPTNPEPKDAQWLLIMACATCEPSPRMIQLAQDPRNGRKTKIEPGMKATAVDELYYHYELHGDEEHIARICQSINFKMNSPVFERNYQIHQEALYRIFRRNTFKSQKELNYNYTLFVHCVTNPNGPQIWRKLVLNGRLTLKAVDCALKAVIGYGLPELSHSTKSGIAHMTDFRFNLNQLKMSEIFNSIYLRTTHLRNEMVVFDTDDVNEFADGMVYRKLRGNCTAPISQIHFGEIADLYLNTNSEYKENAVPFDAFYDKYYRGLYDENQYEFVDNQTNFSFTKTDCFQYGYDWGEEWTFNIYVVEKHKNVDNGFFSRFVDGKGVRPPNDVGSIEAYKWILEKCHFDPYALKMEVGDFKVPQDVYEWLCTAGKSYFDYWCLMGTYGVSGQNRNARNRLISFFRSNDSLDRNVRKKIINELQSGRPFLCPYRPLQLSEIMELLKRLNVQCAAEWNRKLKRCRRKNKQSRDGRKRKRCANCGNSKWTLKKCRRCQHAVYCSRRCQKVHWRKEHRVRCNRSQSSP